MNIFQAKVGVEVEDNSNFEFQYLTYLEDKGNFFLGFLVGIQRTFLSGPIDVT